MAKQIPSSVADALDPFGTPHGEKHAFFEVVQTVPIEIYTRFIKI